MVTENPARSLDRWRARYVRRRENENLVEETSIVFTMWVARAKGKNFEGEINERR